MFLYTILTRHRTRVGGKLMNDNYEIEGYLISDIVEFYPKKRLLIRSDNAKSLVLHSPATGCLVSLIENKPEIVSQSNLIISGWGELHEHVSPNTFYQSILGLRQSLEEIGLDKNLVMTIRRRGLAISDNISISPIFKENQTPDLVTTESGVTFDTKKLHTKERNKFVIALGKGVAIVLFSFIILIVFYSLFAKSLLIRDSKSTSEGYFSDYYKIQSFEKCNIYVNNPAMNYDSYITFIKSKSLKCDQRTWWYISTSINSPRISLVRCINNIVNSEKNYCSTEYYYER